MSELDKIWSIDGVDYKKVVSEDCSSCAMDFEKCFNIDEDCVVDDVYYIFMEVPDES